MAYHQFSIPKAGAHELDAPYGSFETFYADGPNYNALQLERGWYWWPCFPGCLPDGDPCGPFDSEAEAIADAQEGA